MIIKISKMHILEIEILTTDPDVHGYYNKTPGSTKNSGYDIIFPRNFAILSKNTVLSTSDDPEKYTHDNKIGFGIRCQLACDKDCDGKHGYMLMPRSSICNEKIRLANSIGLIDYEYRGEIKAAVDIIDPIYHVEKLKRCFQIVMPDLRPFQVRIVDKLTETERGDGGFGSTGKY